VSSLLRKENLGPALYSLSGNVSCFVFLIFFRHGGINQFLEALFFCEVLSVNSSNQVTRAGDNHLLDKSASFGQVFLAEKIKIDTHKLIIARDLGGVTALDE